MRALESLPDLLIAGAVLFFTLGVLVGALLGWLFL